MTQRKFKHKETGWIASGEVDKMIPMYDRKGARVGEANLKYIEGHDDWQEITEPILVTEDNVEVFGNERLYLPQVNNTVEDFTVSTIMRARNNKSRSDAETVFYYKENARAYIENHKLRFSRADLQYIEDQINEINRLYLHEQDALEELEKIVRSLKESK